MQVHITEHLSGGFHMFVRFENGYGLSVIRTKFSYGNEDGLYEAAVVRYTGPDWLDFDIDYDHAESHGDVRGWLTGDDVWRLAAAVNTTEVSV